MKFCEKLQKLRKEKGYSQEQLADLLDVSRQSVSKWESGTTYPEMDKLLSLCKIFDITLDDLTNDEVTDKKIKEKNHNTLGNVVYAILEMINRSIEMFRSMDKKEILKCITELLILALILLIFKLPFNFVDNLAINVFANFSHKANLILTSIWLFLSNTIYLILFITIFIYAYKIRFLDKFNYEQTIKRNKEKDEIENNPEKEEEAKPNKEEKIKKEKIKTVKERHSFILFDVLGTLFNIFVKICLLFVLIPIIICFVFLVIGTTIALIAQFLGIHYIGIFIALLGATFASAIIMELFIRVLVSSSIPVKRMFIIFLSGLIVLGIGIGITAFEISSTKYIDEIPENIQPSKMENTYAMNDNLFFRADLYTDGINYKVDDSLTDEVKVEITYFEDYLKIDTYMEEEFYIINSYSLWDNALNYLNLLKDDLKDKTVYNYELLGQVDVTITSSSTNIEKIKKNSQNYYEGLQDDAEYYYTYQERIYELQQELENKEIENDELERQIAELQSKLDNINNVIG